ncbi:aspartate/glutamate racemase family protein [Salirhabdus salicampi]|uniref:aspartate/glutamate racemase family protein n=1 Tax=Salirhabdus salicampi TaxID=476102 RepID=UPI0020C2AEEA|nr:aspartate/glutamate racemase family protein [Salirhabdus salicampi]MCP8615733.1 aspartate/glutamate racemase family protein [Salirhabdus salicampi]
MIYYAKKSQVSYGEVIGIIMIDTYAPFIPGDVGNAYTFSFPVRYEVVKGLTVSKIVNLDEAYYKPILEAGKNLVKNGAKAITADCGYMAMFQKRLMKDLGVPVFLTSLLQLHFLKHLISDEEKIGIICANSKTLDDKLLNSINIDSSSFPIVIKGLENNKHFYDFAIQETGELHFEQVKEEVVHTALELQNENPSMKILLLECSLLPPYAKAVQEETGLPVFDYTTMINYVYNSLYRTEFTKGIL